MFGNIRLYQVGINGCMSVNKLLTFIHHNCDRRQEDNLSLGVFGIIK